MEPEAMRVCWITRLLGVVLPLMLAGCITTPQYNTPVQVQQVTAPPPGQTVTVTVGEDMLRDGTVANRPAIRLHAPLTIGGLLSYTVSAGIYTQVGAADGAVFYRPEDSPEGGRVQAGALTDPFEALMLRSDGAELCGVSSLGGKLCTAAPPYDRLTRPDPQAGGRLQTLTYGGRIGPVIRVSYRDGILPPVEAQYDLTESPEITYRGARIRVTEATGQQITYQVIQPFGR